MTWRSLLVLAVFLSSATAARLAAEPKPAPKTASLAKAFTLAAGQEARLGPLVVVLTAEHHPLERGPGGVELFPITTFTLTWHEAREEKVMPSLLPRTGQAAALQTELFGRYTFTLTRGRSDDEVTLTVFRRSCLLRYTSHNQLKHKDGAIIFAESEDLCCHYSDGPNRCDFQVSRAQRPTNERYCVLYSSEPRTADEACCCRFEHGEALAVACARTCKRLTPAH